MRDSALSLEERVVVRGVWGNGEDFEACEGGFEGIGSYNLIKSAKKEA